MVHVNHGKDYAYGKCNDVYYGDNYYYYYYYFLIIIIFIMIIIIIIIIFLGAMMVLLNANDSRCNNLCAMRRGDSRFDNTSSFDDPRNISLLEIKFPWLCWVQALRFLLQV